MSLQVVENVKTSSKKAQVCAGSGKQRRYSDFYPTPKPAIDKLYKAGVTFKGLISEPASGQGHIAKILELYGQDVIASELLNESYKTNDFGKTFIPAPIYGHGGVDFLDSNAFNQFLLSNLPKRYQYCNELKVDNIVTNPPFSKDLEFIYQSHRYVRKKVAMLLKLNVLSSATRAIALWKYQTKEEILQKAFEHFTYIGADGKRKYKAQYKRIMACEHLMPDILLPLEHVLIFPSRLQFEGYSSVTPLEFVWIVWNKDYEGQPKINWLEE